MAFLLQGVPASDSVIGGTNFTMDATTDFVAFRYRALSTSPIIKAEVFINTKTGTPGNLECVLAANADGGKPNISGGVPVDVGGGSPTLVSIAEGSISTGSRLTITFTNPFTPTAGTWYWLVLYPGSGGSGWSASHRYIIRGVVSSALGNSRGDEVSATSTDTGSTFADLTGIPYYSLLTTGDAYLPTLAACCFDAQTTEDVDDTSNPDERGVAFTVPANMTATLRGISILMRSENTSADFAIAAYSNDSQLVSRSVDLSDFRIAPATAGACNLLFTTGQDVSAGAIARVAVKSSSASDFLRHNVYEFGSQARRESALLFRDWWYCHRNGGAGSFTDDKTRAYGFVPFVEFAAAGGGGGASMMRPVSQSGGLV